MPEIERLIKLFQSIPASHETALLLIREPRFARRSRSRYVQLCDYYGIRARLKKSKKALSDIVASVIDPEALRSFRRRIETSRTIPGQPTREPPMAQPTIGGTPSFWEPYSAGIPGATGQTIAFQTPPQTFGRWNAQMQAAQLDTQQTPQVGNSFRVDWDTLVRERTQEDEL